MKHLKSSFQELHQIFERSITVRDIAEPLTSFDHDYPAERAKAFMTTREYDVVGVRDEGTVKGYVGRDELTSGTVGDHMIPLSETTLLRESDPLLNSLNALSTSRWVFVEFLGDPSGIVTRGDLQKAPMRMWLFGLLSLLEMQMLRCIRAHGDTDWWIDTLTSGRLEKAKEIHAHRMLRKEEIDLADCLQIADKATIFRKCGQLFAMTKCESKNQWDTLIDRIQELRNNLAHANDLVSSSWPEITETALTAERLLKSLEGYDRNAPVTS